MQAGRWSVKNQCICFTNLHYQPWRHPVKWRRHWKTWMISWPTPQQTIKPTTTTTKIQANNNNNTHTHNNNHNKQTSKQTKTKTKTKQTQISTKTENPLHVQLIWLYCVLCYMLIVHLFLLCGFLSAPFCLFCCCGWDKPDLDWMVKRQAMLVGIRQKLTFAAVNSFQLDDSTVPLWPLTAFSLTIAQSHSLTVSLTIAQSHSDR